MAKICGIYQLKNKVNNEIYVGQTIDLQDRLRCHKYSPKKQEPCVIGRAIGKYGWENFEVSIIESISDWDLLDEREIYWISLLKPRYNVSQGGDVRRGHTLSEETKKKISDAKKGKKLTPEHISNRSKGQRGRVTSPEVRKRISESNIKTKKLFPPKKVTEETKIKKEITRKINQKKKDNVKVIQRDKNSLEIIRVFDSITEVLSLTNYSRKAIVSALNKTLNSYKGFFWEYSSC